MVGRTEESTREAKTCCLSDCRDEGGQQRDDTISKEFSAKNKLTYEHPQGEDTGRPEEDFLVTGGGTQGTEGELGEAGFNKEMGGNSSLDGKLQLRNATHSSK